MALFAGRPRSADIDQLLHKSLTEVIGGWEKNKSVAWQGYAQNYATVEKTSYIRASVEDSVAKNIPKFEGSTGCDIGCWLGFTCAAAVALGAKHVYGIEVVEDFVKFNEDWRQNFPAKDRLSFAAIKNGAVPLQTKTIDWVYINQVLCNAMPNSFSQSLKEAYRILKPGGMLVLCDSNNPYCSLTLERLLGVYRQYEIGTGTAEAPCGHNVEVRKRIIKSAAPALSDEQVTSLASNTCYMSGEAIKSAALSLAVNGITATSPFRNDVSRAVCNPVNGGALGNITNPFALAAELEELGFSTAINVSPSNEKRSNADLLEGLRVSQGFYIYATK